MSLKRTNSNAIQDAVSPENCNRQGHAADEHAASALANSPTDTPVKIKPSKARVSSPISAAANGSSHRVSSPLLSETTTSEDEESSRPPAKRQKIDLGTYNELMSNSPTPAPPVIKTGNSATKITVIKSNELTALRDRNTQLRENNKAIAKENAQLRHLVAKLEKQEATSDVFEVENKRLERELERQVQENEDLQVRITTMTDDLEQQMSTLQKERKKLEEVSVWWEGQEKDWLGSSLQLQQAADTAMRSFQDLQMENQRLSGECARLNNLFVASVSGFPALPDDFLADDG